MCSFSFLLFFFCLSLVFVCSFYIMSGCTTIKSKDLKVVITFWDPKQFFSQTKINKCSWTTFSASRSLLFKSGGKLVALCHPATSHTSQTSNPAHSVSFAAEHLPFIYNLGHPPENSQKKSFQVSRPDRDINSPGAASWHTSALSLIFIWRKWLIEKEITLGEWIHSSVGGGGAKCSPLNTFKNH